VALVIVGSSLSLTVLIRPTPPELASNGLGDVGHFDHGSKAATVRFKQRGFVAEWGRAGFTIASRPRIRRGRMGTRDQRPPSRWLPSNEPSRGNEADHVDPFRQQGFLGIAKPLQAEHRRERGEKQPYRRRQRCLH
jgi:hypothetical protein